MAVPSLEPMRGIPCAHSRAREGVLMFFSFFLSFFFFCFLTVFVTVRFLTSTACNFKKLNFLDNSDKKSHHSICVHNAQ